MKRFAMVLICLLVIVAGISYFVVPLITPTPLTHDEQIGDTTIALQIDRDALLFPGDCFEVNWQLGNIQAVFLNRQGTVGAGTRTLCASNANFRIMLPDNTPHPVVLSPRILVRQPEALPIFLVIAVASLGIFAALGRFFAPQRWLDDSKQFAVDLQTVWRDVRRSPRTHLICVMLVIVIGIGFRAILMPRELTIDEVESYNSYTLNFRESIASYDDPNNHMLNTVFLFVNSRLFGADEVALRLHVFIFGIFALPLAYLAGRLYYNPSVGLGTLAIMAGANIMVEYSVLARGYMLQTTIFLILLILAYHIIRKNNALSWLLFALLTPFAFFALPTTVYLYLGLGTWMLLTFLFAKDRWQRIGTWFAYTTLAGWLTIMMYVPTFTAKGLRLIIANGYVARRSDPAFFAEYGPSIPSDLLLAWNLSIPLVTLLCVGVVLGTIWHQKIAQHRFPLLLIFLIVIVPTIIIQQTVPFARVWTFLFPIFAMTAVAGWRVLWEELAIDRPAHWGYALAIGLTIFLGVYGLASKWQRYSTDEYHQAMAFLEENLRSTDQDVILSRNPVTETLMYYFERYDIPTRYVSTGHRDESYHFYMMSRADHDPVYVLEQYDQLSIDPNDFVVVWQQDRLWIHEYQPDDE